MDRKREILAREALLDRDHWTVLGIKPGANAEAVKLAYFEASRVFHPDRYYGKNLGSYRARLDRIFHRLSEAHEALTEALRQAPPSGTARVGRGSTTGTHPTVDPRAEERRARLSRHPYLATKVRAATLVEEAQHQLRASPEKALKLLEKAKALGGVAGKERAPVLEIEARQQLASKRAEDEMQAGGAAAFGGDANAAAHAYSRASNLDPARADAAYEAARWLMKAGRPLAEARGFAQRAVSLRADHLPSQLVLAEICLRMGMGSVARRHLEAALKLDPRNAEAKAMLRQVR
ncbi:MAG TPA: DnaJ domain-containing protein [Myxococcaceae bacterium]|nr:DnaJ domain-containing protein [Myxococcaceae bacterium]